MIHLSMTVVAAVSAAAVGTVEVAVAAWDTVVVVIAIRAGTDTILLVGVHTVDRDQVVPTTDPALARVHVRAVAPPRLSSSTLVGDPGHYRGRPVEISMFAQGVIAAHDRIRGLYRLIPRAPCRAHTSQMVAIVGTMLICGGIMHTTLECHCPIATTKEGEAIARSCCFHQIL